MDRKTPASPSPGTRAYSTREVFMKEKEKERFLRQMANLREFGDFLAPGTPPQWTRDEEGRPHSQIGPSYRSVTRITWYQQGQKHGMDADIYGSVVYFWKGVMIPERYFINRGSLTAEEVLSHPNAEVRAVGLEIYGYDRLESHPEIRIVHRDRAKSMLLMQFHSPKLHEPLSIVKVRNSSREPDGSHRNYYLCVPPSMKTCQEAVAWTFDRLSEEYHPMIET
jgi:hypothetical protein